MAVKKIKQVTVAFGQPVEVWLPALYERHGTQKAVANELGVTQGTVSYWIMRAGLVQKTILVPRGVQHG